MVAGAVCYEQLDALDNVKLWSLRTKKLKVVKNPTKQLNTVAKDLKFMGSDNLAVVNYQQLVEKTNLLKLPEELEKKIEQSLLTLITPKDYDINSFPFKKLTADILNISNNTPDMNYKRTFTKTKNNQKTDSLF